MKYIIIGGVAGGATAAARIRRNTEKAEIILFEKGEYISYANCGLPYYIGGVIEDRERLFVQTPESFGKRFNIDIRTRSEVTAIDVKKKEVTVRSSGKTYTESYDKLLLSPGASPVRPPLPGIDTEGIFTLRNVNDTDRIKSYMQQKAVKRAVIVGGGFIGLEMAENLHHSGIEVSVVEMANQVMGPIDYSMASLVHEHLQQKGVRLYLEQAVESFEKTAEGISVHFKSGIQVNAEMVLLSIGVRAETRLATEAGLKLGEMRGIYVNEYLQTSDESVYAVGDAIEFPHPITHKPWLNFLAGPANRQARIVADNMVFGNKIKYEGSIGTAIAKVFDLTVASTGLPAKRLKQMDIPYLSATIHSNSHAGYYPGASMLDIKITFSPTDGKLYGAQIVGYDGVDKRIDEYALTIKRNGTVYDLTELEHAYAPPFSSAKDPVALSGYVAGNILSGKMTPLYWRELQQADLKKVTLVDVRTADEYSLGKISRSHQRTARRVAYKFLEIRFQVVRKLFYLYSIKSIDNMRTFIFFLCTLTALTLRAQQHTLESQIRQVTESIRAQVGVAVIIDGKDTVTVNNDSRYPLMSVVKYPQSLAVAHFLHQHNRPLSTEVFIAKEALHPDTYSPLRDEYPEGNLYLPISRLLEYTLQQSDNNACDILFEYIGGVSYAERYIRSLGTECLAISKTEEQMHQAPESCYENWSSPLEMARLTDMLFSKELFPSDYQNFIKETMLNCVIGENRLPQPLMNTTARIGHKTGTSGLNARGELAGINDVGFVILPDGRRYSIAVLIKDSKETMKATEKVIADISEIVYRYLTLP